MPAADPKKKALKETLSPGDSHVFDTFDACDSLTAVRDELAGSLTDGFLALARERYRDPNAHLRLSSLLYDNRLDLKARLRVQAEEDQFVVAEGRHDGNASTTLNGISDKLTGLRNRKKPTSGTVSSERKAGTKLEMGMFGAFPSQEMKDMQRYFARATRLAVEVANCERKVIDMIKKYEKDAGSNCSA